MMLMVIDTPPDEPKTLHTTFNDVRWIIAMIEELQALVENNTWKLVPLPTDSNVVRSK